MNRCFSLWGALLDIYIKTDGHRFCVYELLLYILAVFGLFGEHVPLL